MGERCGYSFDLFGLASRCCKVFFFFFSKKSVDISVKFFEKVSSSVHKVFLTWFAFSYPMQQHLKDLKTQTTLT